MKTVVINAMCSPYNKPLPKGAEVFGCNGAFRHQHNLTRLYFLDSVNLFPEGFADEINSLPDWVRVIGRRAWPEIPRCEAFPKDDLIRYFNGMTYYTSTCAWMLAQAIREGFEKIILSGLYHQLDSAEYMTAKPCMDFWCGVAMGKGVEVVVEPDCALMRPWRWESPLYGYERNINATVNQSMFSAVYKACIEMPRCIVNADEYDAKPAEPLTV